MGESSAKLRQVFDAIVRYQLPGPDEIVILFRNRLKAYVDRNFPWKQLPDKADGLSSAEISLAAQDAIKDLLINDRDQITMPQLQAAIADRRGMMHPSAA